jgi:magnesium-protoporphyrin O-methyltransferase
MPDCCNPSGYEQLFSAKEARRTLRVYDKKGLNKMAKRTVDYLKSRGVEGHRVLEVGGGIGAVHVELLKAGAASAVNVELSHGYQEAAAELVRREGLEGRVEQRIGDFTEMAEGMEADDVIMNRVICCYPYMERLMNAALSASSQFLAVTFPRDRIVFRISVGLESAYHRIRGVDFRAYIHSPRAMLETARRAGFEVAFDDRDAVWHGVVFERAA